MNPPGNDLSIRFDWQRQARTGIPEVVFAEGKSLEQLIHIAEQGIARAAPLLMTRVDVDKAQGLLSRFDDKVSYHELARCLRINSEDPRAFEDRSTAPVIAIVAAGTSDVPLVAEIEQTLIYLGVNARCYTDVGVAGLWRLTELRDELNGYPVLIAVAGMEGALFSVLAGLVRAPVIAVPSSVGYGVAKDGHAALSGALASCAPGLAVVNIDNGFGAAALAVKMLTVAISPF